MHTYKMENLTTKHRREIIFHPHMQAIENVMTTEVQANVARLILGLIFIIIIVACL